MGECADLTYYQRNRDVILNRAKDYYENDKEVLREQARDKYRNFSEEEKIIITENMGKIDIVICLKRRKKMLKEYKKYYREAKKSQYNSE